MKFFLPLIATAEAATLAITWTDCGDASTHAKVTDLQPSSIPTGSTTTLKGTGDLDEVVNGATFSQVIKADGVQVASCSGDASQDVVCKLPLGVGSITLKAQSFPLQPGQVTIPVDVKVSALVPASLAKTNSHIEALSDTGDKLFCMEVTTSKSALEANADIDCSKAVCEEACTCSLDKCSSEIATCMAAPNCASAQDCALACGCGDTACTLKCAAASPSIKALPAAKCINSNCNFPPAKVSSSADIDCSKATCEEACTCSLDKCASEIATCMAAPNCASAQDCALACGCGDTACTLKCAAASPSIKALPAAKCINSNCNFPPAAVAV